MCVGGTHIVWTNSCILFSPWITMKGMITCLETKMNEAVYKKKLSLKPLAWDWVGGVTVDRVICPCLFIFNNKLL